MWFFITFKILMLPQLLPNCSILRCLIQIHPPPHPLSRRPNRKLLYGQQTGSRLPPLTRRQTRNNQNHHRRHRKVCAHLGIRLGPVNVYSSPYTFPSCVTFNCELPLVETESEIYTMSSRLYPLFASSSTITFPSLK